MVCPGGVHKSENVPGEDRVATASFEVKAFTDLGTNGDAGEWGEGIS